MTISEHVALCDQLRLLLRQARSAAGNKTALPEGQAGARRKPASTPPVNLHLLAMLDVRSHAAHGVIPVARLLATAAYQAGYQGNAADVMLVANHLRHAPDSAPVLRQCVAALQAQLQPSRRTAPACSQCGAAVQHAGLTVWCTGCGGHWEPAELLSYAQRVAGTPRCR